MGSVNIRLKDREVAESTFQPLRLKLDPGSKVTGLAMVSEGATGTKAVLLGEIRHKSGIKARPDARRARRHRKTRYRPVRFDNRRRPDGWLPPSLEARAGQTMHAVAKIRRYAPIQTVRIEHVKFDTRLCRTEISGVEYRQGELQGYEVREYLLEKFGHECAYCHRKSGDPGLEVEHIIPKSRGGTDRVSNLVLACHTCNQEKGNLTAEEYGHPEVHAQAKAPLRDAALMATRWRLYHQIQATGLPVGGGSGARTKKPRLQHGLPKAHYYDALCVGASTLEHFIAIPAWSRGSATVSHRQARISYLSSVRPQATFWLSDRGLDARRDALRKICRDLGGTGDGTGSRRLCGNHPRRHSCRSRPHRRLCIATRRRLASDTSPRELRREGRRLPLRPEGRSPAADL